MEEVLRILWTASLSYLALFILSKLMGKKQIAQLEFIDYAVGISIGSIAAQMSIDSDIPFYHFLIAMGIYLVLDVVFSYISRKSNWLKGFFKGTPEILIEDGKLIYENLKKSKMDINELLSMCRQKNYFDINDIAFCIFETSGDISILPKAGLSPATCKDLSIKSEKPSLSVDFIIDGQVVQKALSQVKKDENWLKSKMSKHNIKSVKEVALAVFDSKNDDVKFFKKNVKEQA